MSPLQGRGRGPLKHFGPNNARTARKHDARDTFGGMDRRCRTWPRGKIDDDDRITADSATAADRFELFGTRHPPREVELFEEKALASAASRNDSGVIGRRPGVADTKPARPPRKTRIKGTRKESTAAHAKHKPKEERASGPPQKSRRALFSELRRKTTYRVAEITCKFRDSTGEASKYEHRHGSQNNIKQLSCGLSKSPNGTSL